MLNEINFIHENARKVKANGFPINTPMYFFISNTNDVIIPNWKEVLSKYIEHINMSRFKILDSGHYIHYEKSDIIAHETKVFLKEVFGD